ncbi:retrovirus-related pol polyprotein from transposon TNT 1-94 [Tanacetum coccineum]
MNRVGYQGVVDKVSAFYMKNLAQPWQTMFKYAALLWINEDYHSIKDDIPLVSVYTIGNVLVQGILISNELMSEEIRATDDFKEYETVFVKVDVLMNQPQQVVSTQGTHRSTPRAYKTPTVSTASPQGKKRKQTVRESSSPRKSHKITIRRKKQSTTPILPPGDDRERDEVKLDDEEIEKMVEGERDEESYRSEFVDSMINDDAGDSGTKIEPESHKEHPKNVIDDDEEIKKEKKDEEIEKEKKDKEIEKEKNIDDVENMDEVFKEKDIDVATGSMEFRKEKMHTPIPSPTRSPRKVSSYDKIVFKELTATTKILLGSITGMSRRRGQIRSHIKNKFITHDFFMGKIQEVLDHCNKVVPEMTFAKTNEMIKEEMPRLVNLAINKDREVSPINVSEFIAKEFATHGPKMIEELFRKHMQNTTLNLYPITSLSTSEKSSTDLQHQLYLNMKSKSQDQAADLGIWKILKAKIGLMAMSRDKKTNLDIRRFRISIFETGCEDNVHNAWSDSSSSNLIASLERNLARCAKDLTSWSRKHIRNNMKKFLINGESIGKNIQLYSPRFRQGYRQALLLKEKDPIHASSSSSPTGCFNEIVLLHQFSPYVEQLQRPLNICCLNVNGQNPSGMVPPWAFNPNVASRIVARSLVGSLITCFGKKWRCDSALAAELQAIRFACVFAANKGWFNVIIESDSQTAIMLATTENFPPWALLALVMDILYWVSHMKF